MELSEQFAVAQHYSTIRKFAELAENRANARTAIASHFGVAASNATERARMASLITKLWVIGGHR